MSDPSEPESRKDDQQLPTPDPKPDAGQPSGQPSGWLDNLARRSTGLPDDESKPSPSDQKNDPKLWRLAGLGIQFAATVCIFAFMGNALDHKMGWSPWSLVTGCLLAVVGNLYLLIKESLREDAPRKRK